MSGLIFYGTQKLPEISEYYGKGMGMELWLDQGSCRIYRKGNLLLGFCEREEAQTDGIITFFFKSRKEVDALYEKFKDNSEQPPRYNPEYNIYHFFSRDPEDRVVEFQKFEGRIGEHLLGSENLIERRSIRKYKPEMPTEDVLQRIFEICRYSPTSRNRQKYYYVMTDNRVKIKQLAKVRQSSSAPLIEAPLCVAVCCAPETIRIQQDTDIAAVYLMLAAHSQGLGTCWITDMNRLKVKEILDIPMEDYVSCVMPLGYPAEDKEIPQRREVKEFLRKV